MSNLDQNVFKYQLQREDYIQYYLYYTSTEPHVVKRRKRSRLLFMGVLTAIAVFFTVRNYNTNNKLDWTYICLYGGMLVAMYMFRLWMEKSRYRKLYEKHVDTNFSDEIGKDNSVQFTDENLVLKDGEHVTTISYQNITQIIEVKDHFYLSVEDGTSIILSKNVENYNDFSNNINLIKDQFDITFHQDLLRKW